MLLGYTPTRSTVWQKAAKVSNSSQYQQLLDAKGLVCPMPLLQARLALRDLPVGEILLVEATDPSSWRDIQKYVALSEHQLVVADCVELTAESTVYRLYIRKGQKAE